MDTVPNYAAALQHVVNTANIRPSTQQFSNISMLAALLAEFHSSMSIRGLRYFNGNIDRFMVFCLLLRTSLSQPEHSGTISVHSAAMSLGRPFETVRRHICALLEDRVCQRTRSGVTLSEAFWARHDNWQQLRYAHDCFVRLIADGVPHGLFSVGAAPATTSTRLPLTDGVCAAIDLYLALAEANRTLCSESLDLAIFSVVLHSNYQALQADRALGGFGGPAILLPRHGVRVAQIARVLSTPDTTVRRRVAPLSVEGGPFRRTTGGLLVSPDYLRQRDQPSNSNSAKHGSIRLIVQRAVAAGLSLRDPVRSYSDGRPPTPRID